MQKISTTAAWLWLGGGIVWFLLWTALALWGPGSKITPPRTARAFFTPAQYAALFGSHWDADHPNPAATLNSSQTALLASWGLNDCVQTDGLASQSTGILDGACFCENSPAVKAIFDSGIAVQPQNTLSTLPLSIAGLFILGLLVFLDPPQQQNFMTVTYFFALCYAFMTIILGPLSMMLHLGLKNWGGWFDSLSLFVWFGFVACYGFFRFIAACLDARPREDFPIWSFVLFGIGWAIVILLPAIMTAPGVNGPIGPDIWYLILGGLALLGELLLGIWNWAGWTNAPAGTWNFQIIPFNIGGRWWFVFGGITFLLALTVWALSFTRKPLCAPGSLQGHAIFHTLSAVALVCLYKYYRVESTPGGWSGLDPQYSGRDYA